MILDVGAHIGLCALPISKVIAPEGKVYAFEPGQGNVTYLKKHIAYNKIQNMEVYQNLVGETTKEEISFYESPEPTGMNAIVHYKDLPNANWVKRTQISLDDFCAQHHIVPDVIKIDVEGAEVGVLKGAQNIIRTHQPTIVLSIHPKHLELLGESEASLSTAIQNLNYTITDMAGQQVHKFELKEYLLQPMVTACVSK